MSVWGVQQAVLLTLLSVGHSLLLSVLDVITGLFLIL